MKNFTLMLASVACGLSAAPAFAAEDNAPLTVIGSQTDDPDTIRIPYGDLNLANAADAAVLRTRVRQAARRTCDAVYDGAFLSQSWACRDVVWQVAAPQIAAAIDRARAGQDLAGRAVVVRFARR